MSEEIVARIARFVEAAEPGRSPSPPSPPRWKRSPSPPRWKRSPSPPRWKRHQEAGSFESLALAAFAFQYQRIAPYRRLCQASGIEPGTVSDWRQIPAVPVLAFKSLELRTAPAVETFRSSGTTGAERSVHGHPYPDLYRRVVDASFPAFCLPAGTSRGAQTKPPMLALIPSREQLPDSSLAFMVDHVLRRHGAPDSRTAFGADGVDAGAAGDWCRERQRDGRPGLILTTSLALVQWLEALAASATAFRLPPGTTVFDTGGFKGRSRELDRHQLLELTSARLGVAAGRVVREYGMTELTSQFYTRVLRGGDPDLFVGPPWLRARIVDPETLSEAPPGTAGVVAVFDLANVGSAVHLLTQDLGVGEGEGFRLLGRASGAELRGCSLTAEALVAPEGRQRNWRKRC